MPTIRTVCIVTDPTSTSSSSENNCCEVLLVNTAEPQVVVVMPPSSSTESSSPKETDKTVQKKSEITPTPPSSKQQQQQQQQQPRGGGGGQLTLASFFTKTNIPAKRKTDVVVDSVLDKDKSSHNQKNESHVNEPIVVVTTTSSTTTNSEAKKSPKKRKLIRESKLCPEPTKLQPKVLDTLVQVGNCERIIIEPVLPPSEPKNPTTMVVPTTTTTTTSLLILEDERYVRLETRYSERQLELIQRANEDVEANETFVSSLEDFVLLPDAQEEMGEDDRLFPNALVGALAALVQGSRLPLAELSEYAHGQLCPLLLSSASANHSQQHTTLTSLSVAEKIKLIAERKPYFGIPSKKAVIDKLQDTTDRFVWRWELTTCDVLLPPEFAAQTKKARACRRRLASYYKAIVKLLELIKSNNNKDDKEIATAEERVLKFEREDEAKRLLEKKEMLKKEAAEKQRIALSLRKEEEAAKKEAEKYLKQQERSRLKTLKEEEKRLKEEEKMKIRLEKERLELEQVSLAEEAKQKQRKLMANFFVSGEKLANKHADTAPTNNAVSDTIHNIPQNPNGHNVDAFWTLLGSSTAVIPIKFPNQPNLRIRRTRHIKVSVTVTVAPLVAAGGFHNEDQCYSERRIISVPNRLKFLKFFEDYRPPYRGTWSKPRSRNVSGRRPFGKEETYLNYDIDSEAEWEEEDVEDGEDLNSIAKDEDEDDEELGVDSRNYNYADGWLARDDAKQEQPNEDVTSTWCLIAPLWNGIPIMFHDTVLPTNDECIVGISWSEARDVLSEHKSIVMPSNNGDLHICMDTYKQVPETLLNENAAATKREINGEELATFCQFIHGCTLSSKEKVVEDFRKNYPSILRSRAELFRKLDSITIKHRIPKGGIIWEVIQATIDELGLNDVLKKLDLPKPSPEISGDASDPTSVRNKAETNVAPGEPADSAKSNKSKRKNVTTHGETSVQENESGNHDSQTMSHSKKQATKKRKRITPESIVTHASVALFASFLSKSKAQGAPPGEDKTQNEAEHLLVAEE